METRLLIGGELVPGDGPELAVENPYDKSTVATLGAASAEQVSAAVAAADEASGAWGAMPTAERAELRGIAADLDLIVTGSSDHHGLGKVDHDLGVNTTDPEQYERLVSLARPLAHDR